MNCVKCGKKINGSEMFCKVCGTNNKVTTDIVNSAIDGNKESLSFLYKLTYKDMYKTVKFAGCPKDSINEVMKDSYVLGFSNLSGLSHPDRFSSWIDKIAIYRTINQLKDTVVDSFPVSDGEDEEVEFIPEMLKELPNKLVGEKKAKEYIDKILGALSVEQRMTIVIFYYNKLSIKEISHGTGCSENTVKDRLNTGKMAVEKQVEALQKKGTNTYGLAPISYLLLLFESFNNIKGEFDDKSLLNSILENSTATEEDNVPVVNSKKEEPKDEPKEEPKEKSDEAVAPINVKDISSLAPVDVDDEPTEEENKEDTDTKENIEDVKVEELSDKADNSTEENKSENVEATKVIPTEEIKESTLTLDVPLDTYELGASTDSDDLDVESNYDVPSHAMDIDDDDFEREGKSLGFKIGIGVVVFIVVIALTVAGYLFYDYNYSDDPIIKHETTTQSTTINTSTTAPSSTVPTTVDPDKAKLTNAETVKMISLLLPTDSHHTPNFVSASASDLIDMCINSATNSANDENAKSLVGDFKKDSNGFYIKKDDVVTAVKSVFGKDVSSSKYDGAYKLKDDKFYTDNPASGDAYNHSYKIEKIITDDGNALNVYYTYYDNTAKKLRYNHAGVVRNNGDTDYPFTLYGSEELTKSEYKDAIGK